mgnify:CR=1 FL=1
MNPWLLGIGLPVLVWWGSTGVVLYLVRQSHRTYGMTVCVASSLAALAAVGTWALRDVSGMVGATLGYVCAIALWGWLEITYLTGRITGPHRMPCDPDRTPGDRFLRGVMTSLHHELLVIGFGLALWWVHKDAVNQVAAETFLVLWAMRWSAKLNLFHGVPNLNEEFFPAHLDYLKSYIAKRRWNWLFPITVGAAMVAFWLLATAAGASDLEPVLRVQLLMVATTLGLAIVEHWFLVLPIPDQKLWSWAESRRGRAGEDPALEHLAAAPLIQPKSTPARQL